MTLWSSYISYKYYANVLVYLKNMFFVYVIYKMLFWKLMDITCSWLTIYLLTDMYSTVVVVPVNVASKHSFTVSCRSNIHYTDAYQRCSYRCNCTCMAVRTCACKLPWFDMIRLKTWACTVCDKMKHMPVVPALSLHPCLHAFPVTFLSVVSTLSLLQ